MPMERRLVKSVLEEKGFRPGKGDHDFYFYYSFDGKKSPVRTKISRGRNHRDISDGLISTMARQCQLSVGEFRDFVGCSLKRVDYDQKLRKLGLVD